MDGLQPSPPTRTVEDGPDLDVSPLSTFTYRCWTFQLGKWHDRKRSFSSDLEGRDMDAQWMRIYIEKTWKDHPKNQMHGKVRPRKGMHFYIISKFHLLFSYVNQKTQHLLAETNSRKYLSKICETGPSLWWPYHFPARPVKCFKVEPPQANSFTCSRHIWEPNVGMTGK